MLEYGEVELTFPQEHIKKYNYMWNNSHGKQTGDWRKNSCATNTMRKIHTESARKGGEAIRSGPVLLRGDSEEEGDYTGTDPLLGSEQFQPHIGCPSPGV